VADALFDTTVLIDYYRGDTGAQALVEAVIIGTMTASYSPVTSFEIWMGITTHEEEIDYLAVMQLLEEAPLSASMARTAAGWLKRRSASQSEALFRDALIAAAASERREPIYTRNARDFTRFYADVRTY